MVVVSIGQGKLKGGEAKTDNGVTYYEFLGVPYAKPPVGNLRFRNPLPPDPWNDERDATSINAVKICCQIDFVQKKLIGSEDCLYLNVYTSKLPEPNTDLLPVMVFIHGGGFAYSNGIIKQDSGPDYLIDNDVVVVTFNYRLGVLGFLSLDIPEASGNMGLKDQVQALKWVQSNIDKFGGDPNNVTIFGISAGSASVDYHILSPLSKGLFHKAILQSGSCLNHWTINYEPQNLIQKLLNNMGHTGSMQDNRAIYEYLTTSPILALIDAAYKDIFNFTHNRTSFGFVPVIEKDFGNNEAMLTNIPYKLFKEGKFNSVPVIKGFCNKEGSLTNLIRPDLIIDVIKNLNFVDHWPYEFEASDKIKLNTKFSKAYLENINLEDDNDKVGIDFFGDLDFVAGIRISGEMLAQKDVPVYFYEFSYDGKTSISKNLFGSKRKGPGHGDDSSYVFKFPFSNLADTKDREVRSDICKMWTNFAKTGKPTSVESNLPVQWNNYKEDFPSYLIIAEENTIKTDYEPEKMAIFKEIYDKYEK